MLTVTKKSHFSQNQFADILPYVAFDEESGLFLGKKSLGFTIEALPIMGEGDTAQKLMERIFNEFLEEESSIQCLFLADHGLELFLEPWKKEPDILKRLEQMRESDFHNISQISPRIFRVIISYSIPFVDQMDLEKRVLVKAKKEKLLDTLKSHTFAVSWRPENLQDLIKGLVHLSLRPDDNGKKTWNPYQTLKSKVILGEKISIDEDKIIWNAQTKTLFKSYRVLNFPNYWTLPHMQALIEDLFREFFRISTTVFLHYGIHFPKQEKMESGFWRRSHLVENHGRSTMLMHWIPELEKELKED